MYQIECPRNDDDDDGVANTNDFNHIMASKLCMADAVLNTNDENKEVLTTIVNTESPEAAGFTICSIEAVTPDRKVAITVRLAYDSASSF